MSRKIILFCCLATLWLLALVGCSTVGPLCRSEEKVRASILKRTPLGCSRVQVSAFIKQQRWTIYSEGRYEGFMTRPPGQDGTHSVAAGTTFVARDIGTTHLVMFPFATDVLAYWDFDNSGRLIDVWVDQQTDAP